MGVIATTAYVCSNGVVSVEGREIERAHERRDGANELKCGVGL